MLSGKPANSPDPTRQVLLGQVLGLVKAAARQAGRECRQRHGQQLLLELQGGFWLWGSGLSAILVLAAAVT